MRPAIVSTIGERSEKARLVLTRIPIKKTLGSSRLTVELYAPFW